MFYFPTEMGFLLALVMIGWLVVAGVKKTGKSVSSYNPDLQKKSLPEITSTDSRCTIKNVQFSPYDFHKYSADVECRQLGTYRHLTAPTYEQLVKETEKAVRKCVAEMDTI